MSTARCVQLSGPLTLMRGPGKYICAVAVKSLLILGRERFKSPWLTQAHTGSHRLTQAHTGSHRLHMVLTIASIISSLKLLWTSRPIVFDDSSRLVCPNLPPISPEYNLPGFPLRTAQQGSKHISKRGQAGMVFQLTPPNVLKRQVSQMVGMTFSRMNAIPPSNRAFFSAPSPHPF
jgi:hypothetical protein